MSESAVAAAVAVAQQNGVPCDDPVVLRDAWHVLVHLRPSPVVARVTSPVPYPEGPDPEGVAREVAVAAFCVEAGCAVVPPLGGPWDEAGHVVTFWKYVAPHADPDPRETARALRAIHDALEGYDGELPEFGHPQETQDLLDALPPSANVEFLREIAAKRPDVGGQALHGDAHMYNVRGSPGGPLWHDFETACRGPREYDLAALENDAALAAYGPYDRDLVEALRPLYLAWVTASMMMATSRRPELADNVGRVLDILRRSP
jgi:phosphotransferase family enzyme